MSGIVRTKTRAEGGITGEERVKLKEHAALWIGRIMRTDPIEHDKIAAAIRDLYAVSGLAEPRVVIVPSPLAAVVAGGFSAAIWYLREHAATSAATSDATSDWGAIRKATSDAISAATLDATRDAIRAATRRPEWRPERNDWIAQMARGLFGESQDFAVKCVRRWSGCYQGGNMWGQYDSFLTAARDILGLDLPQHDAYGAWERATIHGGLRWVHEKFCIVSDFPETLKVDDQNRAHCEDGPSHRWRDGWEIYHWHGVRVPAEWIKDKKQLTAQIALCQDNAELRRAACEIVGWDNVLDQLGQRVVNADSDPEVGTLVEVTIEGNKERFIRVQCGTGRAFALPVPPDMETALQANAWTYGLDPFEYNPEIRT